MINLRQQFLQNHKLNFDLNLHKTKDSKFTFQPKDFQKQQTGIIIYRDQINPEQVQHNTRQNASKVTLINKELENEVQTSQQTKIELANDKVIKQDVRRLENWKYYQNGRKEDLEQLINVSDYSDCVLVENNVDQDKKSQVNCPNIRYKMLDAINHPVCKSQYKDNDGYDDRLYSDDNQYRIQPRSQDSKPNTKIVSLNAEANQIIKQYRSRYTSDLIKRSVYNQFVINKVAFDKISKQLDLKGDIKNSKEDFENIKKRVVTISGDFKKKTVQQFKSLSTLFDQTSVLIDNCGLNNLIQVFIQKNIKEKELEQEINKMNDLTIIDIVMVSEKQLYIIKRKRSDLDEQINKFQQQIYDLTNKKRLAFKEIKMIKIKSSQSNRLFDNLNSNNRKQFQCQKVEQVNKQIESTFLQQAMQKKYKNVLRNQESIHLECINEIEKLGENIRKLQENYELMQQNKQRVKGFMNRKIHEQKWYLLCSFKQYFDKFHKLAFSRIYTELYEEPVEQKYYQQDYPVVLMDLIQKKSKIQLEILNIQNPNDKDIKRQVDYLKYKYNNIKNKSTQINQYFSKDPETLNRINKLNYQINMLEKEVVNCYLEKDRKTRLSQEKYKYNIDVFQQVMSISNQLVYEKEIIQYVSKPKVQDNPNRQRNKSLDSYKLQHIRIQSQLDLNVQNSHQNLFSMFSRMNTLQSPVNTLSGSKYNDNQLIANDNQLSPNESRSIFNENQIQSSKRQKQ